jgi:hypothetical protein
MIYVVIRQGGTMDNSRKFADGHRPSKDKTGR